MIGGLALLGLEETAAGGEPQKLRRNPGIDVGRGAGRDGDTAVGVLGDERRACRHGHARGDFRRDNARPIAGADLPCIEWTAGADQFGTARAHVANLQHPAFKELPLDQEVPLLGIRRAEISHREEEESPERAATGTLEDGSTSGAVEADEPRDYL